MIKNLLKVASEGKQNIV